jgi:hypothetical protein
MKALSYNQAYSLTFSISMSNDLYDGILARGSAEGKDLLPGLRTSSKRAPHTELGFVYNKAIS